MTYCWTTINVSDLEKSLGFYRDILGLEMTRSNPPWKNSPNSCGPGGPGFAAASRALEAFRLDSGSGPC